MDKLVQFDQGKDFIFIEGLDLLNKNVGVTVRFHDVVLIVDI